MGFVVWAVLTLLALHAGLALALRLGASLRIGEQVAAACVSAVALVLLPILGLGLLDVLYPVALGLTSAVLSIAIAALCRPKKADFIAFGKRLRAAAKVALASPFSIPVTIAAALLVLYLAAYAYLFPTWGWDALWYHDPITAFTFQEHSLRWIDTPIFIINSYTRNLELLAFWNGAFTPDDRLIDAVQLPMVLMAVVALASLCRRAGASAPAAWVLGLSWLLMPAVFLNVPSNYVDAGAASLWLVAVLFLARAQHGFAERLFGAAAIGCYLGAKLNGPLFAAILAVPVLAYAVVEVRKTRAYKAVALQLAAMLALVLALGSFVYVRNLARFGNPVWPARARIPLTHLELPGPWDMSHYNVPPFGGPDDWRAALRSFEEPHPFWFVDVRTGGFGPLWLYVLLPACGLAALLILVRFAQKRGTCGAIPLAALFIAPCLTPGMWWPRFTLSWPAAGLLAVAMLLARVDKKLVQGSVALAVGVFAVVQAWPARVGFRADLDKLAGAFAMPADQRVNINFDRWQYPDAALRNRLIQPGEAAIYDDSASFLYQLWRSDWRSRVLYLPLKGDPRAWLQKLDEEKVRWAQVGRGSMAERVLAAQHWKMLWQCGSESADVWVRP